MQRSLRLLVSAFGDAGHAFPALALAGGLARRGHDVTVETWERWREPVESLGLRFEPAEQYLVFPSPGRPKDTFATAAEAGRALLPLLDELRPDVVVSDVLTLAPTLAAEVAGIRHATLVPHLYPVSGPGEPLFSMGMRPPRTAFGRAMWRAWAPALESGLRQGRREMNEARAVLGLQPTEDFHAGISRWLCLVATFPGLEYPRAWPGHVRVVGPMPFELPHPDIDLPAGDAPLVLVAPSTSQDPDCRLVRAALDGLADEPVRVVATTNGHDPPEPMDVPANAVLVDWVSYSQVMPRAAACVCHGGHGTVARALGDGVPVLVCAAAGDQMENGARVAWSGTGLSMPARLVRPGPIRWAVRRIVADAAMAARAGEVGAWARSNDGAARGAAELERRAAADPVISGAGRSGTVARPGR